MLLHHPVRVPARGVRRAWLAAALATAGLALACSEPVAPPPGVSTQRPSEGGSSADAGPDAPPSPRPLGPPRLPPADAVVELPFAADPVHHTIEIEAAPRALDLVFNVDTTASMGGEIDELQRSLGSEVAPQLRARLEDVSFAVARFEDFPHGPWGSAGVVDTYRADEPFRLLTAVTSDADRVSSALASLDSPLGEGGDLEESGAEALWQIATGEGYSDGGERIIERYHGNPVTGGGTAPGVGFREGTLRAVVHVTDAPSHYPIDYASRYPGTHDLDQAASALRDADVRALSILSNRCAKPDDESCDGSSAHERARPQLEQLAIDTDALGDPVDGQCPYGVSGRALPARDGRCPLVFEVAASGEGLPDTLVDAVVALVDGSRFELVSGAATTDPIGFVIDVAPIETEGGPEPSDELPKGEPDGRPDSFVRVRAGQDVAFEVTLQNRVVPARGFAQSFRVVIEVVGDGVVLERRTLRVVVPAADGLVPDAGPDEPADEDAGGP